MKGTGRVWLALSSTPSSGPSTQPRCLPAAPKGGCLVENALLQGCIALPVKRPHVGSRGSIHRQRAHARPSHDQRKDQPRQPGIAPAWWLHWFPTGRGSSALAASVDGPMAEAVAYRTSSASCRNVSDTLLLKQKFQLLRRSSRLWLKLEHEQGGG